MDEIEWMKIIKKSIGLFAKVSVGFTLVIAFAVVLTNFKTLNLKENVIYLFMILLISLTPSLILCLIYSIMYIIEKILNPKRIVSGFDERYIREVPKNVSPALVSLIYDLKINIYKDYTATILYLCIKKYLNLEKVRNTFELKLGERNDYDKLSQSERYVLDLIINKTKLDENTFKRKVIEEAQEKRLITDKKYRKKTNIPLMFIMLIVFLICSYFINMILFYIIFGIVSTFIFAGSILIRVPKKEIQNIDFVDTGYKRTKEGKELALLLNGFKRYIKEYTLIKDKDINYMQILEEYIPYALSLDEADAIENFIKNNEQYRELIYNKK